MIRGTAMALLNGYIEGREFLLYARPMYRREVGTPWIHGLDPQPRYTTALRERIRRRWSGKPV